MGNQRPVEQPHHTPAPKGNDQHRSIQAKEGARDDEEAGERVCKQSQESKARPQKGPHRHLGKEKCAMGMDGQRLLKDAVAR